MASDELAPSVPAAAFSSSSQPLVAAKSPSGTPAVAAELEACARTQRRRLTWVVGIAALFAVAELVGAKLSSSAVLQAEALHLLLDVFALCMNLWAMRWVSRPANAKYTFGFARVEVLVATFNALLVLLTAFEIVHHALEAMDHDHTPDAGLMIAVALVGLVVHGFCAWFLHSAIGSHGHQHGGHGHDHGPHQHAHHDTPHAAHDQDCEVVEAHEHAHHDRACLHAAHTPVEAAPPRHDLNLRGAVLHLLGDALGAVAALVAALVLCFDGPSWVDPVSAVVVAAVLAIGALKLLRETARVLLEAAPAALPGERVQRELSSLAGVREVVELRVWTLGAGQYAVAARLAVVADAPLSLTHDARERLLQAFGVQQAFIELDPPR